MPRNNWTPPVRFLSWPKHCKPNFHSPASFREILNEYAKDAYTCCVDLKKAYDRVPSETFWGVLQEYGVGGRYPWDWRGRSCWLHPRESAQKLYIDQLAWLYHRTCLVPFRCGSRRTIRVFWKPLGISCKRKSRCENELSLEKPAAPEKCQKTVWN